MRTATRAALAAYTSQIAVLNKVGSATEKFAVDPTIAQKLEERIQENADFLKQINVMQVDELSGQVIGLGANKPAAGRTNTKLNPRKPRSIANLDDRLYECKKTDFDTYMTYEQLDIWAKFPDFQARLRNQVTAQIARDRLTIGWNGTSAAADTDPDENPLLQDVNIGWLQHLRTEAPQRRLNSIKVGTQAGADYRNYDATVADAVAELIEPWHRGDTGIVAIVGDGLLNDKYLALLNSAVSDAPTEKAALSTLLANKTLGEKRVIRVPFFPARAILLTAPSNLSIYAQSGSYRRMIQEQPDYDRIVDWLSINEGYVIQDTGACALIENILLPDGDGGWE